MMRKSLTAFVAAAVLGLSACSSSGPDAAVLERNGLAGKTATEIVQILDTSSQPRPMAIGASVREDRLVLSDDQGEVSLVLPSDRFYLSIAPFVSRTHECYYHSLATCQGELVDQDVHVTITDSTGAVLVDEDTTTRHNGFVGFWLPRDVAGTVTVTQDGRRGQVPFSTSAGSPTCLTTLQLA